MKKLILSVVLVFTLISISPSLVSAQFAPRDETAPAPPVRDFGNKLREGLQKFLPVSPTPETPKNSQEPIRALDFQRDFLKVQEKFREKRLKEAEEIRKRMGDLRLEITEKAKNLRNLPPEERGDVAREFREVFEKRKEELHKIIEERKQKTKELKEEWADRIEKRKAEIEEKLKKIRDERKKRIAPVINERLADLNKRLSNHFLDVLAKMEVVLANITTRTDKAEARGADVSAVREAIDAAHIAIAEARAAVEAQLEVVYEINIEGDENLRDAMRAFRDALHEDLRNVREKVKEAREAVRSAAVTLAQIPPDILEAELEEELEGSGETEATSTEVQQQETEGGESQPVE